ncbi:MAG: glycosyltransferase [Bryobacteraceae bacterium]
MPRKRPLISCVMPTANRTAFALRAVDYFLRQDYPERELIIVDSGADDLSGQLPDGPRIRYLRVPSHLTIGAKRNFGCEQARGTLVAQWDDDDWHGPRRLSFQASALTGAAPEITGLSGGPIFDVATGKSWRVTKELDRQLFPGGVNPRTLLFPLSVWRTLAHYPDRNESEDGAFLRAAIDAGATLRRVANSGVFVYVRHDLTAWPFRCGHYLDAAGWRPAAKCAIPPKDREFYTPPSGGMVPSRSLPRIAVGIVVRDQPDLLQGTLASVRLHTGRAIELIILGDGPGPATQRALSGLDSIRQSSTRERSGTAACFNRLANLSGAELLVLLESGAQVGPRWLDALVAALEEDPRNGLAGPATNQCWNEQQAVEGAPAYPSLEELARIAALVGSRFGPQSHTLEPLYSLADFCYAVRREVVERIGAADENYSLGPCWEMDYNIRATRAGFRGVWTPAAYVHRMAGGEEGEREQFLRFESSRQRYQDKFCALRLRNERHDYEPHCRGDECEHFAPTPLIQVRIPMPGDTRQPPPPTPARRPLVSCIMPTANRPDWARQAALYFQRQDWAARELIIVDDDGGFDLASEFAGDPRIRYFRLPSGCSIGYKRNYAIERARGAIIVQWDDDDWYAPQRLTAQVGPIAAGEADITALRAGIFFDVPGWKFWTCTPDLHRSLFVRDVHGGTLAFRRRVWEEITRYPDASLAEDAAFLDRAVAFGSRLLAMPNGGLYLYVRHRHNAWSFPCGEYLDPGGWSETAEPDMPAEDRAFYLARSGKSGRGRQPFTISRPTTAAAGAPLASCIMPTANRRAFVPHAIRAFLLQDYPNRELLIVEDGEDSVEDLIPADPRIRYMRLRGKQSVGAKRNLACQESRGEIILHWDDDDWAAPWRIRYQVERLQAERADICGLDRVLFYGPTRERAWLYVYPPEERPWVFGGALCYTLAAWRRQPFQHIDVGEDNEFVWNGGNKVAVLEKNTFFVSMIHGANTSPKATSDSRWLPRPAAEVQSLLGADWSCYAALIRKTSSASAAPPALQFIQR